MQNDADDKATNFIYQTPGWNQLQTRVLNLSPTLNDYAVHRWFNFWSAQAIETIFLSHPKVSRTTADTHQFIDFSIESIPFDHKTTVFPESYPADYRYARSHPGHLIKWLYAHQSQQQRHHLKNRLFVILYARDGDHWKLRADISGLQKAIHRYLDAFREGNLYSLQLEDETIRADYIWYVK